MHNFLLLPWCLLLPRPTTSLFLPNANPSFNVHDLTLNDTAQTTNASTISNATLNLGFKNYNQLSRSFDVPHSNIHFQFSFPTTNIGEYEPINPIELRSLLLVAQFTVNERIGISGRGAIEQYPIDPQEAYRQTFGDTLGDGFELSITNMIGFYFTWGMLRDVLEGLMLYLVVGKRPYLVSFDFWDVPRGQKTTFGNRLGSGAVRGMVGQVVES